MREVSPGGLIAAAVGVALMQALLARGTRKRVRNAIADASTASVSSMSDSDAYGIVQDVQMTDTAVSATQSVTQTVPMADSGESDVPAAQNVQNNVPDAQGVRHVKVADAAHSAAQAALEAAQAAQQAAQVAQQVAQTGRCRKSNRSRSHRNPSHLCPASNPSRSPRKSRSSPTRPQGRCADDLDDLPVRRHRRHGPLCA